MDVDLTAWTNRVEITLDPLKPLYEASPRDVMHALSLVADWAYAVQREEARIGIGLKFTFYLYEDHTPEEFLARLEALIRAVTLVRHQMSGV